MLLIREFWSMPLVKALSSEIDPRNDGSAEGLKSGLKKYIEASLGIIRSLLQLGKIYMWKKKPNTWIVSNLCSCHLVKLEFSCLGQDPLQVQCKVVLSHLTIFLMTLPILAIMGEILTLLKSKIKFLLTLLGPWVQRFTSQSNFIWFAVDVGLCRLCWMGERNFDASHWKRFNS